MKGVWLLWRAFEFSVKALVSRRVFIERSGVWHSFCLQRFCPAWKRRTSRKRSHTSWKPTRTWCLQAKRWRNFHSLMYIWQVQDFSMHNIIRFRIFTRAAPVQCHELSQQRLILYVVECNALFKHFWHIQVYINRLVVKYIRYIFIYLYIAFKLLACVYINIIYIKSVLNEYICACY